MTQLTKEEIEMIVRNEASENSALFMDAGLKDVYEMGYKEAATKYLLQLKAERERAGKLYDIVQKLADWSKKYPRGPIYPMSQKKMDDELIQIEELAKTAINEYNNKP